jgi:hypothetical protein
VTKGKRRRRGVVAFVAAVAGISLAAPYVLNQTAGPASALAKKYPRNPITAINNGIHKGSS